MGIYLNRFLPTTPTPNIELSLDSLLSQMSNPSVPWAYTGAINLNTEAQWNAVTWTDSRMTKPDWATYFDPSGPVMGTAFLNLNQAVANRNTYEIQVERETVGGNIATAIAAKFNQPSGTVSQYIRGDGSLATMPTATARTFNNPTRSLNTSFQPSATQDAMVSYSVDIACSLSLAGGQAGTVYLRYADDSAFTTNVTEVCRFAASNTGTLTIGLALNQVATGAVSGVIPAGKYVRLVTANDTGTPTFTYRRAQEVLI